MSDTVQYEQIRKLLSSLQLFNLGVEQEILDLIAECAMGKLLNCLNEWCCNEILILNEHKCLGITNRSRPKPSRNRINYPDGTSKIVTHQPPPDTKNKIADHSFHDTKFNVTYYYDRVHNNAYCNECTKIMKLCGEPLATPPNTNPFTRSQRSGCGGLIFDNKPSTYTLCACSGQKRMCKDNAHHGPCPKCGHSVCNMYSGNDYCSFRECGSCTSSGCLYCVEMTSCDMVLQSMPPQYVGAVYKCKNNACSAIIPTVLKNDKDYVEFKRKYDVLREILGFEEDILINIAEYATGKVVNCSNKRCVNEILVLCNHDCVWSKQKRMGYGRMRTECSTYVDTDNNVKYYYLPTRKEEIAYCETCLGNIAVCGDGFLEMCGGRTVVNDNTTYHVCGCSKENKICLTHKPCARCKQYVCHDWGKCDQMQCSSCAYEGCTNCVEVRGKCMNNGCSKTKADNSAFNSLAFGMVSCTAIND
eukprot:9170_1